MFSNEIVHGWPSWCWDVCGLMVGIVIPIMAAVYILFTDVLRPRPKLEIEEEDMFQGSWALAWAKSDKQLPGEARKTRRPRGGSRATDINLDE